MLSHFALITKWIFFFYSKLLINRRKNLIEFIFTFSALLRGLGAFFIKRKIDPVAGKKDIVYRAVLHTYMQHALAAGHNVEFFIEGGRTRTGKPCMPKSGVLSGMPKKKLTKRKPLNV